ncbi:uncharacterized protein PAC_05363 [Phialocephala subalpina]|uniref:DNA-directed RNA polymerase II subunit RPB1 n=1 Tax=Phialocephala subalpina TaxID=576137 RepID=A0A1L7WRW0_9HELO|nr:uncharacterized protein PAC_05363 [Phialocephala subalpina]
MDAHALLTSQGWRGTGNSLHPTSNAVGLSRPLLVSKKVDNLGIGKKQHRTSDMWWMNAFDSSLKGLDTSTQGTVVQTVTSGGLDMVSKAGAKWVGSKGGLYASFVRGESLSGTITPIESESTSPSACGEEPARRKRKRDAEAKVVEGTKETKEERRARKAAKRAAKAEEALVEDKSEEIEEETSKKETKEERKARKAAKRALREQEAKASEPTSVEDTPELEKAESKEERKERKRLKKLAQEAEEDTADLEKAKKRKKRRKDE